MDYDNSTISRIKKTLTQRGQDGALSVFQRTYDNRHLAPYREDLDWFVRTFTEYHPPRVHLLTPFGVSVNTKELNTSARDSHHLVDQGLVHDYAKHSKLGSYHHTPIPELLLTLQRLARGSHTIDIIDTTGMQPYQVTRTLPILKLERGFRYPRRKGKLFKEKVIRQAFFRYSSNPRLFQHSPDAPAITYSFAKEGFGDWHKRNRIPGKLAQIGIENFGKLERTTDGVVLLAPTSFSPNGPEYNGCRFILADDGNVYYKDPLITEKLRPLEAARKIHVSGDNYIEKVYGKLNDRLLTLNLVNRSRFDDTTEKMELERLLERYKRD